METKETSPLAIASLAFSCLGALTLGILTMPWIICGVIAKNQIRRGEYSGGSLAQAGIIVGVAILILYILIPILLFGGIGIIALAARNLELTIGVTGVLIMLTILPFLFTGMSRRREARKLRELIEINRSRS